MQGLIGERRSGGCKAKAPGYLFCEICPIFGLKNRFPLVLIDEAMVYEYAVLVTSVRDEIFTVAQLYL